MKIKENHVYHLSKGKGYGIIEGHDVVVMDARPKSNECLIGTITSLERYSPRLGAYTYDLGALKRAKNGTLVPIPMPEIGTSHWSGIDLRQNLVKKKDLRSRRIVKIAQINNKYWK